MSHYLVCTTTKIMKNNLLDSIFFDALALAFCVTDTSIITKQRICAKVHTETKLMGDDVGADHL